MQARTPRGFAATRPFLILFLSLVALPLPALAVGAQGLPASIPLELGQAGPVVEVEINGKGPFSFLIATHDDAVAIDRGVAEKLGLKGTGKAWFGAPNEAGSVEGKRVVVESIALGRASFDDVEAILLDVEDQIGEAGVDGILGFPFFANVLLTLDYVGGRLTVEAGELGPADGKEILDLSRGGKEGPAIRIEVAGQPIDADLDSARFGGLFLPESFLDELPLEGKSGMIGMMRTPAEEFVLIGGTLAGNVTFGTAVLERPNMIFADLSPRVNLGNQALADFAVTFDQANHRVRFIRKENVATQELHLAAANVASLGDGPDLKTAFNQARGKTRLLLILSPT